MRNPEQLCLVQGADKARTVHIVLPDQDINGLIGDNALALFEMTGQPQSGRLYLVPGVNGVAQAVFMIEATTRDAARFGALATGLPAGDWQMACSSELRALCPEIESDVTLGFCMGAYRYAVGREIAFTTRLVLTEEGRQALPLAAAIWLGRDLINQPANLLGPRSSLRLLCRLVKCMAPSAPSLPVTLWCRVIPALPQWVRVPIERRVW